MLISVWVSEQNPSFKEIFNRFETRNPVLPGGIEECQLEAPGVEAITDFLPKTGGVSPWRERWGPRARRCLLSAHSLTTAWDPVTALISYFKCFPFLPLPPACPPPPCFSKMSFYVGHLHTRMWPLNADRPVAVRHNKKRQKPRRITVALVLKMEI